MSLAEIIAKRKAEERAAAARRANPELEAKLDRFIAENPQLHEHLRGMSRDELVRNLMAEKMERAEAVAGRNRELEPWVRENPEIVAKVEERFIHLAAENRERASIRAARSESIRQGVREPGIRP
jgi:hypothetical protein